MIVHARPDADREAQVIDGRLHGLLVQDAMDLVQQRLALLLVELPARPAQTRPGFTRATSSRLSAGARMTASRPPRPSVTSTLVPRPGPTRAGGLCTTLTS